MARVINSLCSMLPQFAATVCQRLSERGTTSPLALGAEVIAGRRVEYSWATFKIVHFPGMDDLEAADELGEWARSAPQ